MKRRVSALFLISVLLLSLVASFVHPGSALAASLSNDEINKATFTFQDRANIVGNFGSAGKITFTDANVDDGTNGYKPGSKELCDLNSGTYGIVIPQNANWGAFINASLNIGILSGQKCLKASRTSVSVSNSADVANGKFEWNANDIETLPGESDSATYSLGTNTPNYYEDNSTNGVYCPNGPSAVLLNSSNTNQGTLYCYTGIPDSGSSIPAAVQNYAPSGVELDYSRGINIAGTQGTAAAGSTASTAGSGTGEGQLTCDNAFSSGVLLWAICGVVDAIVPAINALDNLITSEMTINTGSIFNVGTCSPSQAAATETTGACISDAYHSAWASFRNIALGLMVVSGLIVLIAQALGFELLDAYMMRKTLPRLLIAAIGITLSWPLMSFFITLSNDLGFGIRHLIYAPFSNLHDSIDLQFSGGAVSKIFGFAGGTAATLLLVPTWIAFGGAGALLAYLATAGLAVLIAILVLVLRQVAIILLLILAPIAIAAYVLPNTQRIYHLWWESFSKALMMFPIIAGFIAAGRVFSAVSTAQGGLLGGFVGFVSYFAPYFLIPATFKLAGGAVRQLGGFVNDRSRGGFDRLRQYRNQQISGRVSRARGSGLYKKQTGLTGFMNRVGFWTLEADHRIPQGIGQNETLNKLTGGFATKSGVGLSKAAFGGMAQEMAGMKGRSATQHDQKALQENPHHYAGDYAVLGMREKFKDDLDGTTLARLDQQFGTHQVWDSSALEKDENGNETGQRGAWVDRWGSKEEGKSLPGNTDTLGWAAFAQDLQGGSRAGSQARRAGEVLARQSGILTRLGVHEDVQRATIRSVAVANLSQQGKLSPDDQARVYGEDIDSAKGDISGLAIASARNTQNETLSTNARHATRTGKAVGQLQDGTTYSFLSNREVRDKRGNVVMDDRGQPMIPAHTKEALENLLTLNPTGVESTKGEVFDDLWHAATFWGTQKTADGNFTPEARSVRDLLVARASSWGRNDPGGRVKLDALLGQLDLTPAERQRVDTSPPPGEMASEEAARQAQAAREAEEANRNNPNAH